MNQENGDKADGQKARQSSYRNRTSYQIPRHDPIIDLNDVSFRHSGARHDALSHVSLEVTAGECVMLCGQSGCGKTTLTHLLNGLAPMFFSGDLTGTAQVSECTAGRTPIENYVPVVGSVFQNPKTQYFNADTTAELAFPCENSGMTPNDISARIGRITKAFGLRHLLGRSIFELSGGEKQRIAFAAACMLKPRVLVLDEPTSNLDDAAITQLHDMLITMKRLGVTIIIAEHRLAWARDLTDRYVLLEDGHVAGIWNSLEFQQFDNQKLRNLSLRALDLEPIEAEVTEKTEHGSQSGENLRQLTSPRSSGSHLRKRPNPHHNLRSTLLEARDLSVGYRRKRDVALHINELELKRGEIVALMAPNGHGKTTLAKTLCGLIKPLGGKVLWNGRRANRRELRRHAFMVMQDVGYQLFCDSVREEVTLGATNPALCDTTLEALGLDGLADRHPMSLSGGQKQRVAIATAMLSGKELIVMDEPTSGLDRLHMEQVGAMMQHLAADGKCVLVVTHDTELAASACDRVIRLDQPS